MENKEKFLIRIFLFKIQIIMIKKKRKIMVKNNNINGEFALVKLHFEKNISLTENKIKEENEDKFNEKGNLIHKMLKKCFI